MRRMGISLPATVPTISTRGANLLLGQPRLILAQQIPLIGHEEANLGGARNRVSERM